MGEYFEAVDKFNMEFPTLVGDFFPYNDAGGDYWTGYFTSRPFLKRRERILQAYLYAADVLLLDAMTRPKQKTDALADQFDTVRDARRNLALVQHHDAITGTSKLHVMRDYGQRCG
jgi:hypothetical protein